MSNLQLKRYATIANPDVLFISQALRHQDTTLSFSCLSSPFLLVNKNL